MKGPTVNRKPPKRDRRPAPHPRAERRERNRRKPDLLAAARVLLALALVAQCLRVAFTSPRLRLTEVRVTGTDRLDAAQVVERAQIPLRRNIFRVNLVEVARRLEADPVFGEALVTRDLPNRLHIELRERQPALRVTGGQDAFDADAAGVLFQPSPAPADPSLPALEVPPAQLPPVGGRLDPALVRTVSECRRLAEAEGLQARKMRVDASGELWLTIGTHPSSATAADGLHVRVGRPTDLPEKFRDIRQVTLVRPQLTASAAYLNVMCAGRPAYMRASPAAATP